MCDLDRCYSAAYDSVCIEIMFTKEFFGPYLLSTFLLHALKNSVFAFFFLVNSQASGKQNTIPFRQIILYALKLPFSLYSRLKLQQGNSRPVSLWYPIAAYLPCLRSIHSCSTGQVIIYFLRLVLSYSILIIL